MRSNELRMKDLRMGNYIQTKKYKTVYEIEYLTNYGYLYIKNPKFEYTDDDGDYPLTDYEPIPLTEEWLIKMNFQRVTDVGKGGSNELLSLDLWLCDGLIHFYANNDNKYSDVTAWYVDYGESCENYFRRVQYVNQLQNLYFALTGEELTIKE